MDYRFVKVNLLEESHRNCDKISGYCQLYEIYTFHCVSHSPPPSILRWGEGGPGSFRLI